MSFADELFPFLHGAHRGCGNQRMGRPIVGAQLRQLGLPRFAVDSDRRDAQCTVAHSENPPPATGGLTGFVVKIRGAALDRRGYGLAILRIWIWKI